MLNFYCLLWSNLILFATCFNNGVNLLTSVTKLRLYQSKLLGVKPKFGVMQANCEKFLDCFAASIQADIGLAIVFFIEFSAIIAAIGSGDWFLLGDLPPLLLFSFSAMENVNPFSWLSVNKRENLRKL
jgi:hypothetical protein